MFEEETNNLTISTLSELLKYTKFFFNSDDKAIIITDVRPTFPKLPTQAVVTDNIHDIRVLIGNSKVSKKLRIEPLDKPTIFTLLRRLEKGENDK